MEHVVGLAKDDSEIKTAAIGLINAYGRRNINELRRYYDELVAAGH